MLNDKGYSQAFTDPKKAEMAFDLNDFENQIHEFLAKYMDNRMKKHEEDLSRYQEGCSIVMNGLIGAILNHVVQMKCHAGAQVTDEFLSEMFDDVRSRIMKEVNEYDRTKKCPGCHSTH